MDRRALILACYTLCKYVGMFHLARRLTRPGLRILCYHGFALADEDRFRASLFLRREIFEERMRFLVDQGYPVLPLDEAVRRLWDGTLPPNAVTITIDDGFYSTFAIAREVLLRHRLPATLYLTSYYFQKGIPIFRLAVAYLCWKSKCQMIDLSGLGLDFASPDMVDFAPERRDALRDAIVEFGEKHLDEAGRVALSRRLGERMEVDYDQLARSRVVSLVSEPEVHVLERAGIAIELHTHRHSLPTEPELAIAELEANRAALGKVLGRRLDHFCYPSGDWSKTHWPALERCGIVTAATCDAGLAYPETPRFALPRILDDGRVAKIEFEAELTGFSELLRRIRSMGASKKQP